MKKLKPFLFLILLFQTSLIFAQEMMQTTKEAYKLKDNENQFINKPLKSLLKEIKPQIKMVHASGNKDGLSYFSFRFVDSEGFKEYNKAGKQPLRITVFVKEKFVWDYKKRGASKKFSWTEEDIKNYGNLTVVGIRIFGEE